MVVDHRRSFLPPSDGAALDARKVAARQDGVPSLQFDLSSCLQNNGSSLVFVYNVESGDVDEVNTTETTSYPIQATTRGQIFRSKDSCGEHGEKCSVVAYNLTSNGLEVMILNDPSRNVIEPVIVTLDGKSLSCLNNSCEDGTQDLGDKSKTRSSTTENAVIKISYCPGDSPTAGSTPPASDTPSNNINIPALAGGVSGGVVFLLLSLAAFIWWRRRRYISGAKTGRNAAPGIPRTSAASRRPPLPAKEYLSQLSIQTSSWKSQEALEGTVTPISPEVQEFTPTSTTMLVASRAPSAFRFPAQNSPNRLGSVPLPQEPPPLTPTSPGGTAYDGEGRPRAQSFKRGRLSDRVVAVEERIRTHSLSRPAGQPLFFTADGHVSPGGATPPLPSSPVSLASSPVEIGPMSLRHAYRASRGA